MCDYHVGVWPLELIEKCQILIVSGDSGEYTYCGYNTHAAYVLRGARDVGAIYV